MGSAFGNAMRPLLRFCGAMMATLAALCLLPRCVAQGTVDDPQLLGSTMVIRRSKMYVFGGMGTNSTVPQNILWEFDMNARSWTWVTPQSEDKPAGRMFHQATMTYDGRYMVIYGGVACFSRIQMVSLEKGLKEYHMQTDSIEYSTALEDVWMFDFVTRMWSELSPQRYARRASCPTAEGVVKLTSGSNRRVQASWLTMVLIAIMPVIFATR